MDGQLTFLDTGDQRNVPERVGSATVRSLERAQVLTRGTGFMSAFDYTLNPYVGCQFGCAYCYAAFFVNTVERRESWGEWVDVKVGAVEQLAKKRTLHGKSVYMSSVTDPYQPIERKIELTRRILSALAPPERQPRLVIQTRSPMVTRDLDVLTQFRHLRVNVTVTTDSDDVRKRFEPLCPSNAQRIQALAELKSAGLRIGVCITPMLPLTDPDRFAEQLASLEADVYVAQPFKPAGGWFGAATRQMALDIVEEFNWTAKDYSRALDAMRLRIPCLYEGKDGFIPE